MVVLSEELALAKAKTGQLADIKNLNMWGNDLHDISIIKEMKNVEVLSLSVNKIESLEPFSHCQNLTELYVRKNAIADLREVRFLTHLKNLKILWLCDNPCADTSDYRSIVIQMLPQLTKLDNKDISDEEVRSAAKARMADDQRRPSSHMERRPERVVKEAPGSYEDPGVAPVSRKPSRGADAAQRIQNDDTYVYIEGREAKDRRPSGGAAQSRAAPAPAVPERAYRGTPGKDKSSNILYAVLCLLDELDEDSLEIVRQEVVEKTKTKARR